MNNDHIPEEKIASYAAGTSSPMEREEIELHCLECHSCRKNVACRLLAAVKGDIDIEELEIIYSVPKGIDSVAMAEVVSIGQLDKRVDQRSLDNCLGSDLPLNLRIISHQYFWQISLIVVLTLITIIIGVLFILYRLSVI